MRGQGRVVVPQHRAGFDQASCHRLTSSGCEKLVVIRRMSAVDAVDGSFTGT
jgi:hypothetical protein